MFKIRNLLYFIIIGTLLVSGCTAKTPAISLTEQPAAAAATATATEPATTATPEPLPELDPAVKRALSLCEKVLPGQVCLVEGPVQVKAQPESYLMPLREPGQVLNLSDILSLKLGEAGSPKGILMLRIQTEWPEGAFTAVAFGDV